MTPLEKLQEIARAATPGPWEYNGYSMVFCDNDTRNAQADVTENGQFEVGEFFYEVAWVEVLGGDTATLEGSANAAYIATFNPRLIEKLLAEMMAARMLIDSFHANSSTSQLGLNIGFIKPFEEAREALDALTRGLV